jgi:hypothetical protein
MINLIWFSPARNWEDRIYVDPSEVIVIKRCHYYDRDMGEYSTLTMKNGETLDVAGLPQAVAKAIRDAKEGIGGTK